jgi:hypothetical protein
VNTVQPVQHNMSASSVDSETVELSSSAQVIGAAELNAAVPCVDRVVANALLELYHEQPVTVNLPPNTVSALRSLVALRQSVDKQCIGGTSDRAGKCAYQDHVVCDNRSAPATAEVKTTNHPKIVIPNRGISLSLYQEQLIEYLTKHARHPKDEAMRLARMACKKIELNFLSTIHLKESSSLSGGSYRQKDSIGNQDPEHAKKVRGPYRCYVCGKATGGEKKNSPRSSSQGESSCRCLSEMLRVPLSSLTEQLQQQSGVKSTTFNREALRPYLATIVSDIVTLRAEYSKSKRFADVKNKKKQLRKGAFCPKTDTSSNYKCSRCKLPIGCKQHRTQKNCLCLGLCRCQTVTVRVPFDIWANESLSKSSLEEDLLSLFYEKVSEEMKCGMKGKKRQIMLSGEESVDKKCSSSAGLKSDDKAASA